MLTDQLELFEPVYTLENVPRLSDSILATVYLGKSSKVSTILKPRSVRREIILVPTFILQAEKFPKCDWLRPVVFEPNLKYLHVKTTASFHGY